MRVASQGLSLIDSMRAAGSQQQQSEAAEAAQVPLFAAAAAFRVDVEAAAPGVGVARALLRHLRREATGDCSDEGPQA